MALYRYEAAAATGEVVRGEMDALSQEAVIEHLHGLGYVPIRADTAREGALGRFLATLSSTPLSIRHDAKPGQLAFLTQQLGMLLHAGLPLDRALEISLTVITGKVEREAIETVLEKVRGGSTLADAMAAEDRLFPAYYVGMVRAGEASASLDSTLKHLAELLERTSASREQVKSALIYPSVVLVTGIGSIAILFGYVIPRFRPLFEQAGADLPFSTRMVLGLSDTVRNYGWLMAIVAFVGVLLARRYIATAHGRRRWDGWMLRLPGLGDLVTKVELSRLSRTLGTLLRNGVSPLAALGIAQKTIGNMALRDAMEMVVESVKEGKGLADPLARTGRIPDLAVQLTRVGEETARLDEMLLQIGDIYEQESKRSIDRLVALLVPAVTILLGVVVALVIGSVMSAILGVYDLAM